MSEPTKFEQAKILHQHVCSLDKKNFVNIDEEKTIEALNKEGFFIRKIEIFVAESKVDKKNIFIYRPQIDPWSLDFDRYYDNIVFKEAPGYDLANYQYHGENEFYRFYKLII